jgi:MoaA/NifB/PqqE/SkfB family radical SAM enzyme
MCARNIQGGIESPFISIAEISKEQFIGWFPESFIKQLDRLYMCGNLGDPIMAKDTLEIFDHIRSLNNNIVLSMNTNGSARTSSWWVELAKLKVNVRFGIDGLADTHSLYRIGTDWNKIIENAKTFISAGGYAGWDMLTFKHNEHQIDDCRKLSNDLGFKVFTSKNTSRFKNDQLTVIDRKGKTSHVLYPTEKSKDIKDKMEDIGIANINCKAVQDKSLYISATGNVTPCCWLDSEWYQPNHPTRIEYLDLFENYLNLQKISLEDIFYQDTFKKIEKTWISCSPLKECTRQCGKVDRFNEQF